MSAAPTYRPHLAALALQAAVGLTLWLWPPEHERLYLAGLYLATAGGVHLGSFWWFYTRGRMTRGWALWHAGAPALGLPLAPLAVELSELFVGFTGSPRPELAAFALGVVGARGVVEMARERLKK